MFLYQLRLLLLKLPNNLVHFNFLLVKAGLFLNTIIKRPSERISIVNAINQNSHKTYLFLRC